MLFFERIRNKSRTWSSVFAGLLLVCFCLVATPQVASAEQAKPTQSTALLFGVHQKKRWKRWSSNNNVPELNMGALGAVAVLLIGGTLVVMGRRRKKPNPS